MIKLPEVDKEGYLELPCEVFIQGSQVIAQIAGPAYFKDFVMAARFKTTAKIKMVDVEGESAVIEQTQ